MPPVKISQTQQHLYILRGLLADKPPEVQEQVKACMKELNIIHAKYPDVIIPAITLVTLEITLEDEKKEQDKKSEEGGD